MYKTHIEFGAIPRDEGAKFGILLEPVHLKVKSATIQIYSLFKILEHCARMVVAAAFSNIVRGLWKLENFY